MQYKTSRILNESKIGVFGLDVNDFFILIGTYGFAQFLMSFILELNSIFAMLLILIVCSILIYIRNNFRRHILRDYLSYKMNKFLFHGVRYDKAHKRD